MIQADSVIPNEFRSGGVNIVPVFLVAKIYQVISGQTLDANGITVLARLLLMVVGTVLAGIFFRYLLKLFGLSPYMISIGTALLLLNPTQLAFSRYWYPDHYLIFPIVLLLYSSARVYFSDNPTIKQFLLLGFSFALLLSTKYTAAVAAICLIPLPFLRLQFNDLWSRVRQIMLRLFVFCISFVLFFSLFNYGIFFNHQKFISDFKFNIQNYSQIAGGLDTSFFYLWTILISPFGLIAFAILPFGIASLLNQKRLFGISLLLFPASLIFTLSRSGITFNRNMAMVLPVTTLIFLLGLERLLSSRLFRHSATSILSPLVVTVLLLPPIFDSFASVRRDTRPESRSVAAAWIAANVSSKSSIGVNEFCSGISPAEKAGRQVQSDRQITLDLDYYILNSYWDSPLSKHYQTLTEQRYFHFYRFRKSTVPFLEQRVSIESLVPHGYKIIQKINGNGPEIVILEKIQ